MTKTRLFKKLFSGFTILLILFSQSPLGSILGTIPSASADITSVTIVSPNGGEHLRGTNNITWTSDDPGNGLVDIYYCRGANCFADPVTISGAVANSGSYSRNTNTIASPDANDYKIIVSKANTYGTRGTSTSSFGIDNTKPTVNAGDNEARSGTLGHGTAEASDANGIASYLWSKVSGEGDIDFGSPTSLGTTMHASADGTYVIQLLVTDTFGNTGADTMQLIWDETAPVITLEGSSPVTVEVGDTYTDAGATVADAREGEINDHLSTVNNVNTSLVGSYTVTYNANDTLGNAATQVVRTVNVVDTNSPIVASMGSTTRNAIFTQTGTVADTGIIASYLWSQTAGVGTITFGSPTALGTTISASEEGVYTIKLLATDASGNTGENTLTLTWDNSKPTVDVGSNIITNTGLVITGVVNGDIAGVASYLWLNEDTLLGLGTYDRVDSQNIRVVNFTANATYTLGLLVTDNAGNTGYDTMELTWDTTAPTVSSIVSTPNPGSGTVNVTVYFTEALAGIYISQPPTVSLMDGEDLLAVTPSGAAGHTNGYIDATPTTWEGTIDVSGRTNGTLHFKVTGAKDNAGNTMADATEVGSFVVDTAGPIYTINDGNAAGPITGDIFNITLSDTGTSVSNAWYGFSTDMTCDVSDTYNNSFASNVNFLITGNYGDSNTWLCLKAIDSLGNVSYNTPGLILNTDNTAPAITAYTLTDPDGGEYLSGGSTFMITWNSGYITDTGGLGDTPITIKYTNNGGSSRTSIATNEANDGTYTWTVPNENVDNAFVVIIVTDIAGNGDANTSYDTSNSTFTIDSTAPVVTLTNRSYPDEMYTNDTTPTFTGRVTDSLTNIASVEYSLNGGERTNVGVSAIDESFNSTSENYSITLPAQADGTGSIIVRATDAVGNVSTSNPGRNFVIDTTTPTIDNLNVTVNSSSSISVAGLASTTGSADISQAEYYIDTPGSTALNLGAGTTSKNFNGTINISGLSNGTHTIYVRAKNLAGTRSIYASQSFNKEAVDITPPVLTMIGTIASSYQVSQVPATWTGTANENGTLSINGVQTAYTAGSTITVNLSSAIGSHTYTVRITDAAGNYDEEVISYNVVANATDTTPPTISYTAIANQYNVSAVPANIVFTLADNTAVTTLTLNNGSSTTNVFGSIVEGSYTLALSTSIGLHEYILIAGDAAGNTITKTITYNVVADSVTNINIQEYTVSNLSNNDVTISRDTDATSVDSKVDLYTNGSSMLNQTGTIDGTSNSISLSNSLTANKTYTVVIKSKAAGQINYTTLSFTIKTASASDGIIVNSISRILNGNNPIAGGGYISGYHFRFDLTLNSITQDILRFKLANRSNSATTMAAANNTKVVVSSTGVDLDTEGTSTTLTAADTYSSDLNISSMDADANLGGNQIMLDMFYKIPSGSQGIFSTSYGIQADHMAD